MSNQGTSLKAELETDRLPLLANKQGPSKTRRGLQRLVSLSTKYRIPLTELKLRMDQLGISPHIIDKQAYLDDLQVDFLDQYHVHLKDGGDLRSFVDNYAEANLYRCKNCGDLYLTIFPIHQEKLLHACSRKPWCALSQYSGELELIATGKYNRLLEWAVSVSRGYDNPYKF